MSVDRDDVQGDEDDGPAMAPPRSHGERASTDRSSCTATTTTGRQCRAAEVPGFGVCYRHLDQRDVGDRDSEDDQDDRPVWDRHAERVRRGE